MFTASLPRQAGRVARRQLSTLSPLLSTTSRASPAFSSIRLPRTSSIRTNVLQQLPSRCYSSEAAAQRPVDDSESNIITKFAEMPKIGVNQALVDSITKGMGYEDMTPVQSQTITPAMQGVDLVAQAKTGTGKTLAFLVPLLHRILESNPSLVNPFGGGRPSARDVQAIILSPTRELAEQIGVEAQKLVKGTGLKVQIAVGGTRKREALAKASREGCHILVATPGRLNDILSDPSSGIRAPRLQTFVLDEADRMLDVGFADELRNIQDFLPSKSEVDRQTLLFSATMSQKVISLAKDLVKRDNFRFVRTFNPDSEEQTHERVPQNLVPVEGYENFYPAIMEIADRALQQNASNPNSPPFKAIVFFGQTVAVQYAYRVFRNADTLTKRCPTLRQYEIHSKLDQPQRTRSADNFRRAQNAILFSSDVTARGMDFPGVTHVIQVGLPPDREQYIHRIGRTGRAGKEGEGWLLLAKGEIQEARSRLFNLPIKPNDTLQTSGLVIGKDTPPGSSAEYIDDISGAYKNVRGSFFEDLYNALLGQKFGRALSTRDALELVNNWARRGLGLDELPLISPNAAKNKGLSIRDDVNIGHRPRDDFGSDSGFGGGYGGRDSGGRGFGGRGFGGRDSGGRGFGGRDSGGRGFGGRDSGGRRGNTRDTRSGRDDIFSNDFDSGSRSGRGRGRASF